MTTFRRAWARMVSFSRKRELGHKFDEELPAHAELATRDHIRRGITLQQARSVAFVELGGIEVSEEVL